MSKVRGIDRPIVFAVLLGPGASQTRKGVSAHDLNYILRVAATQSRNLKMRGLSR